MLSHIERLKLLCRLSSRSTPVRPRSIPLLGTDQGFISCVLPSNHWSASACAMAMTAFDTQTEETEIELQVLCCGRLVTQIAIDQWLAGNKRFEAPNQGDAGRILDIPRAAADDRQAGPGIGHQIARVLGQCADQQNGTVFRVEDQRYGGAIRVAGHLIGMGTQHAMAALVQKLDDGFNGNVHGQASGGLFGRAL